MSPIPKQKSPIEKALDAIRQQVQTGQMPQPTAVIVHPDALQEDGPLTKAWKEWMAKDQQRMVSVGQQVSGISWDEQHSMDKTELERQLEDSLWALVESIVPATPEEVEKHLPHFKGSSSRVRKVHEEHVLILCPCKTAMQFYRCKYVSYTHEARCSEEVRVIEAGSALCRAHR